LLFYSITSNVSYITYGDNTKGDILYNISKDSAGDIVFYLIQVTFSLVTLSSYPILFFEGRNNLISIIQDIYFKI